jgi:hypothetical protein
MILWCSWSAKLRLLLRAICELRCGVISRTASPLNTYNVLQPLAFHHFRLFFLILKRCLDDGTCWRWYGLDKSSELDKEWTLSLLVYIIIINKCKESHCSTCLRSWNHDEAIMRSGSWWEIIISEKNYSLSVYRSRTGNCCDLPWRPWSAVHRNVSQKSRQHRRSPNFITGKSDQSNRIFSSRRCNLKPDWSKWHHVTWNGISYRHRKFP